MSYRPTYVKGDWKAYCDVCGRVLKASLLQKRWDGLMVCEDDWEPRQPQDFVRGRVDKQLAPWTRDEPSDTFQAATTTCAIAGLAIATSAICGRSYPSPGVVPSSSFTEP